MLQDTNNFSTNAKALQGNVTSRPAHGTFRDAPLALRALSWIRKTVVRTVRLEPARFQQLCQHAELRARQGTGCTRWIQLLDLSALLHPSGGPGRGEIALHPCTSYPIIAARFLSATPFQARDSAASGESQTHDVCLQPSASSAQTLSESCSARLNPADSGLVQP